MSTSASSPKPASPRPYRFPLWIFLTIFLLGWPLAALLFGARPPAFWSRLGILLALLGVVAALAGRQLVRRRDRRIIGQLTRALRRLDRAGGEVMPLSLPLSEPLQEQLHQLLRRLSESYQANIQFTQNASHELQTPLAIIKGNVELLLQSDHLSEEEITALGTILQNTNRLSKLNSALILLAKIDNRRFVDDEHIDIRQTTEEVLHHFGDLIRIHGIELRRHYRQAFRVRMSETLAEILVANLMQNAIRHNIPDDGFIEITIENRQLAIANPGAPLDVPPESLFRRFERQSGSEESLGLGLSIAQRICERYGFGIRYLYQPPMHTLVVDFGPERETGEKLTG